jgi:hypothetical protein
MSDREPGNAGGTSAESANAGTTNTGRWGRWWPWRREEYNPDVKPRKFGQLHADEYITERLNDYLRYYDKTAKQAKSRYLRFRTVSVVAGALVPVFVNLDFPYVRLVTTVLSVLVVLIVSLESVFHYREQ